MVFFRSLTGETTPAKPARLTLVVDNAPYTPRANRAPALHLRLVAGTAFNAASAPSPAEVLADPAVQALFAKMGYQPDDPTLNALFKDTPATFQKLSEMPPPKGW